MKKKFTMLFAALLACGGAMAQTVIKDATELSNEKVYTIVPKDAARGAMYATSTSTYLDACGGTLNKAANPEIEIDPASADQQFALYNHDGSLYLYSVGAGKFVSDVESNLFPLVEQPGYAVAVEKSDTEGYFIIKVKGTEFINVSTGWSAGCVGGWNSTDDGNRLQITEVAAMPEATLQQLVATFSKQVELSYVYKFEGETVKTETVIASKGEAYPQPAVPFGVDFTMPEGNVADDAVNGTEVIITCTLNDKLPFAVSTLTDGKFGENMAWYHLTMRDKDVTYDASTGKALTGNVAEKNVANLFAFTGNPFDGYSIYNYVAGADKVLYPANGDNGTRAFFTESASSTWMLYKNTDAGYQFRMKDIENGWLNDHKPDLAIWNYSLGATDGGSTFTFTLVENPELTTLYEVTYNYMHEGKVIASETSTVEAGAEYPACNYQAPYGVVVGAKPTGNVEATSTHEIALTIERELPFETAVAANSITTWYYTKMHTNQPGYLGDIADGNAINVAWGKASDVYSDNYVWGFVGNVFDGITVVNKGTGLQLTSTGSGNVTLTANGTPFFVARTSETSANATNGFCLRKKDSNNYLNANYSAGKLSHWSSTDAGSTFFLTEYEEAEVSVSDVDWATMYLDYAVYIPEGVNAYTVASTEGGYATLNQLEGVIPANTGVLLENEGEYTFQKAAKDPAAVAGNLLQGSAADTYVEGVAYVLANGANGVGLYKAKLNKDAEGNEGDTHFLNNAGKAYLVLPAVAEGEEAPAMFTLGRGGEDEDTTGIDQLINANGEVVIYDLAGRRVEKMEKGIYIVNGKKVVK